MLPEKQELITKLDVCGRLSWQQFRDLPDGSTFFAVSKKTGDVREGQKQNGEMRRFGCGKWRPFGSPVHRFLTREDAVKAARTIIETRIAEWQKRLEELG